MKRLHAAACEHCHRTDRILVGYTEYRATPTLTLERRFRVMCLECRRILEDAIPVAPARGVA